MAHHLEPAGAVFEDLGRVLANLPQHAAAGLAGTARGRQVLDVAAQQILRERLAATARRLLVRCLGSCGFVLGVFCAARGGDVGQHLIEPQLKLRDLVRQPLRRLPVLLVPQPRDLSPQLLRLQCLDLQAKLGGPACRLRLGQLVAQRCDHRHQAGGIIRQRVVGMQRHNRIVSDAAASAQAATRRFQVSSSASVCANPTLPRASPVAPSSALPSLRVRASAR